MPTKTSAAAGRDGVGTGEPGIRDTGSLIRVPNVQLYLPEMRRHAFPLARQLDNVIIYRHSNRCMDDRVMADSGNKEGVRLDRWLWAARFYKTRSLAVEAIGGGKVQLNGHRAKRAKLVHVGDEVRVRKGPFEQLVMVRDISNRRGSAKVAQQLYDETAESLHDRERMAAQIKSIPTPTFKTKGRPTKKERRDIDRFRRG